MMDGERMSPCLHPVGRWGEDVRCGLSEFHDVHDPLGHKYGDVPFPMEVHPYDVFPPLCSEDEPPTFMVWER